MSGFVDLTGRHTVTVIGSPTIVEVGGYWGNGYADFDGTSGLRVTGNESDFAFSGDYCIDFSAYRYSTGMLSVPGPSLGYTLISARGVVGEFESWRISDSVGGDLTLWSYPTVGGMEAGVTSASYLDFATGWHQFRVDRRNGVARIYIDGMLINEHPYTATLRHYHLGLMIGGLIDWTKARCRLSHIRITKASREGLSFLQPRPGAEDPLWGQTVLYLSMTADLAPVERRALLPQGDIQTFFSSPTQAADFALSGMLLDTDGGLTTAVILSLFTDARARPDDATPHGDADLRGWWGDSYPRVPGDSLGSRLWLVWPGKQTAANLLRARDFAQEALRWLVDDGIAGAVAVAASNPRPGILAIAVTIDKPSGEQIALRFESLWSLT